MAFKLRRGPEIDRLSITPAEGELLYSTDEKKLYVGDGITLGGNEIGGGSSESLITYTAGEALGGHRAVFRDVNGKIYYGSSANLDHRDGIIGITTGAAAQGANVEVLTNGELVEPSWNWTMNLPILLSTSGVITQAAPMSGFSLVLGFPLSSQSMFVRIGEPVTLAS